MARTTFVFRHRETPVATLPLRASRFTVSQVEGRTRFGLTPLDAVRDIKAANARGGRKGAISRRKKLRLAAGALALAILVLPIAVLAEPVAAGPRLDAAGKPCPPSHVNCGLEPGDPRADVRGFRFDPVRGFIFDQGSMCPPHVNCGLEPNDPRAAPPSTGRCRDVLRDALAQTQEFVRDPDETLITSIDLVYRTPCRACELRAEAERVERLQRAVRAAREALARCPTSTPERRLP